MIIHKDMDYISILQCMVCKHRITDATCKAFPDGIPDAILQQDAFHWDAYPGDNGIRYEQEEIEIVVAE
jgi:hypothetical protein